jgi:hypothetical protein
MAFSLHRIHFTGGGHSRFASIYVQNVGGDFGRPKSGRSILPYYIIPAPYIIVSIKLLEEFGEIFTDAFWVMCTFFITRWA